MKELKERLLFVVLAIIVFRIGSYIPVPGLDPQRLHDLFNQQTTGILGLFNMFSGGALSRLTVFAMGIMPYVSASIIIQLFTAITPKLDSLKKEGESGRRKINQYTRYFTLTLAAIQSLGMAKLLASSNIPLVGGVSFYFITAITLTTGTMFLMWLGEQISEKGIGNGISLIIFSGIVSGLPSAIGSTIEMVRQGQLSMLTLIAIIILMFAVIAFVVFVERAQRKIKVNYTQKQQGNKMYAAQSTHLPLKINMAGVIPPIFASSIILFPASLTSWFSKSSGMHWLSTISLALTSGFVHIAVFSIAIIFFSFFYTALVFNPKETAENLKKSGGYILGIRPGEQTANYIDGVMTRLTLAGAIYLMLVCLMPEFMNTMWHLPFYFGGTSLLIIVVVIMDFISQVQAQIISQQYQSLMKKAKLKLK